MQNENNNNYNYIDKSIKRGLGILIAILVIFGFVVYSKLNSIQLQIDRLHDMTQNNMNYEDVTYSQIKEIIAQQLENQTFLNVQSEWSGEYKDNKIYLDCNVILNQAKESDVITLFYKNNDDITWKSETLTKDASLRYDGKLTLDLFKTYEYYVVLEGETMQASKVASIPREYYLIEPMELNAAEIGTRNGKTISVNIYWNSPETYKSLIKGISFKSYRIDIYSEGKVIDSQIIENIPKEYTSVILFEDYDVIVDKIVTVAILTDGLEIEGLVFYR